MGWLRDWRRARILKHETLDTALWRETLDRYEFLSVLSEAEQRRLAELTILFLHEKSIHGAGGMAVREDFRVAIAAQASLVVLNLGLDYYRGWVEVIVYPDEFVAEYDYLDEAGVEHHVREPMSGESWERGPVLLSWADAEEAGTGHNYNVAIHEFAHKLDMLNGAPNGFPPLHVDMDRARWTSVCSRAYADFCKRVDRREVLPIDGYAAESPAEFFAVVSEAFFEAPLDVRNLYGELYDELTRFYRQDPALRVTRRAGMPAGRVA